MSAIHAALERDRRRLRRLGSRSHLSNAMPSMRPDENSHPVLAGNMDRSLSTSGKAFDMSMPIVHPPRKSSLPRKAAGTNGSRSLENRKQSNYEQLPQFDSSSRHTTSKPSNEKSRQVANPLPFADFDFGFGTKASLDSNREPHLCHAAQNRNYLRETSRDNLDCESSHDNEEYERTRMLWSETEDQEHNGRRFLSAIPERPFYSDQEGIQEHADYTKDTHFESIIAPKKKGVSSDTNEDEVEQFVSLADGFSDPKESVIRKGKSAFKIKEHGLLKNISPTAPPVPKIPILRSVQSQSSVPKSLSEPRLLRSRRAHRATDATNQLTAFFKPGPKAKSSDHGHEVLFAGSKGSKKILSTASLTGCPPSRVNERVVYEPQPSAYWTGRFVCLNDHLLEESVRCPPPDLAAYCAQSARQTELERAARVLGILSTFCRTRSAVESLFHFRIHLANIRLMPELVTDPALQYFSSNSSTSSIMDVHSIARGLTTERSRSTLRTSSSSGTRKKNGFLGRLRGKSKSFSQTEGDAE